MTQYQTTDHHPRLGIEVHSGLDLKSLTPHQQSHLKNTLWQHGVAVCRNQHFTAEELEQFAADTFGPLMFGGSRDKNAELPNELISRHVAILGNPSGPVEKPPESVACQWHHDKDALPKLEGLEMNAPYVVMLHAHKVPDIHDEQRHSTHFLDQQEALKSLSPERQRVLKNIKLIHSPPTFGRQLSFDETPAKSHPLISEHQFTAEKNLYMGSDTAIPVGSEDDPESAKAFWYTLLDEVLASCNVYAHSWQEGDIVMWDNSQVMHCGQPYDSMNQQRIALRLGVVAR
ncbi:TauD/TfdA family dioxygenase [uncultured Endozoicomonas sp.]|uniref:TauD/TfdA dioxygenase family protein n=1 Tax=uncultured Endozoicomonas sp. TaxID=432652 RepID=UPI002634BDBE|nr:TauD/TfdA family dioxygenase [uncultured Endozoicomonas sp.]